MHFPVTLTQSYRSGSKNELLKITTKLSFAAPLLMHLSPGKEKKNQTPKQLYFLFRAAYSFK